ncbi:MAG: FtsX-like permease family protein [Proteobacteria bacterium]|nr:FtsX-like permease family protein [Pseudomonadota bacterium]
MKWLKFAIANVLRNRRRSLVTIVIAAVGTAGVLVGGGFALFTYESLAEMAARDSGHLILAHHDYFSRDEDTPMQHGLENYTAIREKLEQDERVRMTLPRVQFSGLISNGDKSAIFIGAGIDPDGEFSVKGPAMTVVSGSLLSSKIAGDAAPEVVIGAELAKQMKAEPGGGLTLLSTTTSGSLNALDVKVRGIVSVGVPEIDKRLVYVTLSTAQHLLLTDKASTLSVYLRDTEQTEEMRGVVASLFPDQAMQTWRDQAYFYEAVRSLYNRIFGLLGLVIVIMVLFAVSNTLAMAVVERTREIGTLRALGTLPAQIVRIFALEGLVLGVAGVVGGMLAAAGISVMFLFFDIQMPPPPGRSVGYPLQVNLSFDLYALTFLCVVALSVTAAWLVSRKAAAKPIVEALGHV